METRDKIIEIFQKLIYSSDNTSIEQIADEILALPLYPQEFVEWYFTEGQFKHKSVGFVMNPLAEAYALWKDLPENKEI